MSVLKPFMALRPTPELASKVAALPYDVMSSDEARIMVRDNPYSFLHVDKAEIDLEAEIDLHDPRVYAKASENLLEMETKGILKQDGTNCFYIYRLVLNGRAQTGLVACASVDEYLSGDIKKHELTREDKELDRIRHVDICNAQTGPIFLAYKKHDKITKLIDDWTAKKTPVYDFVSEDSISHIIWVVDDASVIKRLSEAFLEVPTLYIADGHHRNASAVKVALKRRAADPNFSKDAEFNSYLSVIFPADELYIMDYNRVVKSLNGYTKEEFIGRISEEFTVSPKEKACSPSEKHSFGMYFDGDWYLLSAKPEIINKKDPIASLDVSILQNNILGPILGISDQRTSKEIDFIGGMRGLSELKKRVDSGEMKVAFSMFATSMEDLMSVADDNKIMPPKSTWFEPKLRSGLFIHKLD